MKLNFPIRLESERAWRTYLGGRLIDELQGKTPAEDTHFPEDWIISVVRAINQGREDIEEGVNRLSKEAIDVLRRNGDIPAAVDNLADLIAAEPEAMLGRAHVAKWGAKTAVLCKVIDAAERLGVQCHPDKEKAMEFFSSPFGKTESWHIIGGREVNGEKPYVYMGFKPGITEAKWRDTFERQDIPAMLGMLHRIEVKPGDTFLIEGGMPHAIGAGCLLVEVQEPTDYTFKTEKVTLQGLHLADKTCHYGIGFDNMFKCFHFEGYDEQETRRLRMVPPKVLEDAADYTLTEIIGYGSTPCFSLERLDVRGTCRREIAGEFEGLYVISGRGTIGSAAGESALRGGAQFFVPACCTGYTLAAAPGETLSVFRIKSAK